MGIRTNVGTMYLVDCKSGTNGIEYFHIISRLAIDVCELKYMHFVIGIFFSFLFVLWYGVRSNMSSDRRL